MATASYPYVSQIRAQGRVEGRREDILRILEYRGISVPDEVRDVITTCDDTEALDHWLRLAIVVRDGSELLVPRPGLWPRDE
jgi:hypothetical protein